MSQFYSGADLKRGVLQRCGEPTDGTSQYDAVALKYINQIYFNVISGSNEFDVDCGEPWPWARANAPMILTLQATYNTGSVALTNGSTLGVFSSPPALSAMGQYIHTSDDNNPEHYRIISHIGGNDEFTLDGPYNGVTNSAANFFVDWIVYELGSQDKILRLVEPFRVYFMTWDEDRNYQIYGLDANSFNKDYPLSIMVGGVPTRFMTFINDAGNLAVRFNETVGQQMRVEVDYIPMPAEITDSDTSIPLIPRPFRAVLEYGASSLLLTDKTDGRAQQYFQLTTAKLKALVEAFKKEQSHVNSKSKGAIQVRQEFLRVRQRLREFIKQT